VRIDPHELDEHLQLAGIGTDPADLDDVVAAVQHHEHRRFARDCRRLPLYLVTGDRYEVDRFCDEHDLPRQLVVDVTHHSRLLGVEVVYWAVTYSAQARPDLGQVMLALQHRLYAHQQRHDGELCDCAAAARDALAEQVTCDPR